MTEKKNCQSINIDIVIMIINIARGKTQNKINVDNIVTFLLTKNEQISS